MSVALCAQANPTFWGRAGRWPGATDLLAAAGFLPEDGGAEQPPALQLRRNDPGLLWLALAAVQDGLTRLA